MMNLPAKFAFDRLNTGEDRSFHVPECSKSNRNHEIFNYLVLVCCFSQDQTDLNCINYIKQLETKIEEKKFKNKYRFVALLPSTTSIDISTNNNSVIISDDKQPEYWKTDLVLRGLDWFTKCDQSSYVLVTDSTFGNDFGKDLFHLENKQFKDKHERIRYHRIWCLDNRFSNN